MAVDLSGIDGLGRLRVRDCRFREIRAGGWLSPALGVGVGQELVRPGTRYACEVDTARMKIEPHGRLWAALIHRAGRPGGGGALLPVKVDGLVIGAPGSPIVASPVAAGRIVPLAGLQRGYSIRAQQPISIRHAGRRYLDFVATAVVAEQNGTAVVELQNLLRCPLDAGDAVELASPKIEGRLVGAFEFAQPLEGYTSFQLVVEERC